MPPEGNNVTVVSNLHQACLDYKRYVPSIWAVESVCSTEAASVSDDLSCCVVTCNFAEYNRYRLGLYFLVTTKLEVHNSMPSALNGKEHST